MLGALGLALLTGAMAGSAATAVAETRPQYLSLKANEVNLRAGPGTRYPVEWVYRRKGLPMEVLAKHYNWRKVRDWTGTVGWIHRSLLSHRRTAVIIDAERPLTSRADTASRAVARATVGVIASVTRCPPEGAVCQIEAGGYEGWLDRGALWGVAPGEVIE